MASIALERTDVIVGVDTHKDEHVAVAPDGLGRYLGELFVPSDRDGYARLVEWAGTFGKVNSFGVEGCGSYGSGLYRFLRRGNHSVTEVNRPARKGERRLSGKSDIIDAEHAARGARWSGEYDSKILERQRRVDLPRAYRTRDGGKSPDHGHDRR